VCMASASPLANNKDVNHSKHINSNNTLDSNNSKYSEPSEFSSLMTTLLSSLASLKDRIDNNTQSTDALRDKASHLKGQLLNSPRRKALTVEDAPSPQPQAQEQLKLNGITHQQEITTKQNITSHEEPEISKEEQNECIRLRAREQELLKVISKLDVENQTLADAVEEFQTTMDLVMEKYRQEKKFVKINKESAKDYESLYIKEKDENDNLRNENVLLKKKIEQMISVMQMAVQQDEDLSRDEESVNEQLATENEVLRQLLQISDVSTITV